MAKTKPYLIWLLSTEEYKSKKYSKLIAMVYKDKSFPFKSKDYEEVRDYIDQIDPYSDNIDDFEESFDEYQDYLDEEDYEEED